MNRLLCELTPNFISLEFAGFQLVGGFIIIVEGNNKIQAIDKGASRINIFFKVLILSNNRDMKQILTINLEF